MIAKSLAGYSTTMVDALGSLLSRQIKASYRPEVVSLSSSVHRLSQILKTSNMTSFHAPYPIITTIGLTPADGRNQCYDADHQSIDYEWHPYEFGSWSSAVRKFVPTELIGTSLDRGMPMSLSSCTSGFDDVGFVTATSINTMNFWCTLVPGLDSVAAKGLSRPYREIIAMTTNVHQPTYEDQYGLLPNPFFDSSSINNPFNARQLFLVGGHQGGRELPLLPLLQVERNIDVIIINDNSNEQDGDGWPTGAQLYESFLVAREAGQTRMPTIPDISEIIAHGLSKRGLTVFGCNETNAATILYMPNRNISVGNSMNAFQIVWSQDDVNAMINNGRQIAQGAQANTATNDLTAECVACVLMNKISTLPAWCNICLQEWCW